VCTGDVLFLVDASGSINDQAASEGISDGWGEVTNFVAEIAEDLNVESSGDRVSVIGFSSSAQIRFDFDEFTTTSTLINAITGLPYSGGYTNTPMAFTLARNNAFDVSRGARVSTTNNPNADIIVLVTDGEVTLGSVEQMVEDATYLKSTGAAIIGVGISENVNLDQMARVVTSANYLLELRRFQQLRSVTSQNDLVNLIRSAQAGICGSGGVTPASTPSPSGTTRTPGVGRR